MVYQIQEPTPKSAPDVPEQGTTGTPEREKGKVQKRGTFSREKRAGTCRAVQILDRDAQKRG